MEGVCSICSQDTPKYKIYFIATTTGESVACRDCVLKPEISEAVCGCYHGNVRHNIKGGNYFVDLEAMKPHVNSTTVDEIIPEESHTPDIFKEQIAYDPLFESPVVEVISNIND